MLQDVGWNWIKFENGQIVVATFLDVARCCARLASSFTTSHNTMQQSRLQDVALKSCVRLAGPLVDLGNTLKINYHPATNISFLFFVKDTFLSYKN